MRYLNLVKRVANWPDYFLGKVAARSPERMEFRLRSGDVIDVPSSCVGEFKQIFFGDLYTRGLPHPVGGGGDMIDIGANVGCFTLFAVAELGARRVIAFEPDPNNFRQLAKNAERNPHRRIIVMQQAVGRTSGEVSFYNDPEAAFTIGGTLLGARGEQRGYAEFRVKCTTLSDILEAHGVERCSLLKLDCEGAEFDILETAEDKVLRRIDRIVMEVHEMPGCSMQDIVLRLKSAGFESRSEGPILWAWRENPHGTVAATAALKTRYA
jgi:FkbM family methyltransferase